MNNVYSVKTETFESDILYILGSLLKERNNIYLPPKDIQDLLLYKREGPFTLKKA